MSIEGSWDNWFKFERRLQAEDYDAAAAMLDLGDRIDLADLVSREVDQLNERLALRSLWLNPHDGEWVVEELAIP